MILSKNRDYFKLTAATNDDSFAHSQNCKTQFTKIFKYEFLLVGTHL